VNACSRTLLAFRVVQAATLVALLWKVAFFVDAAKLYYEVPLRQPFFPAFFQSALTFASGYTAAVLGIGLMLIARGPRLRQVISWLTLIALSVLCLHQGAYNDATFTTAWWTTLWSAWFAGRMRIDDESLLYRGARLSQAILTTILLGGAVGKWTGEYWSGQVFYEIYFIERDFWLFNLLRARFEPERLGEIATWYARGVIGVESVCGLTLWALPRRVAAVISLLVLPSIAIFSSFYLFSVVLSLMGLAAVGLLVPADAQRTSAGSEARENPTTARCD